MRLKYIHRGKYVPKNIDKYVGDINNITYRSSWEQFVMRWADMNPNIIAWGSEVTKIKYRCGTDDAIHTYHVDFTFRFKDNTILFVEVKPLSQTKQPIPTKGKKKTTLLNEGLAYIKNTSKWKYAIKYAKENNGKFEIWTEVKLQKMGFNQI
jgi:hypothetical protein